MPTQILMPVLSPTMGEGKLAKWLVKEGEKIRAGTVIAEIETDKATMEVGAVDEGTLARILVPEGTEKVQVNTPIAVLLADGESSASLGATAIPPAGPPPRPPEAAGPTRPEHSAHAAGLAAAVGGQSGRLGSPPPQRSTTSGEGGPRAATDGQKLARRLASPLARRLAKEGGIDLAALKGSGPHGRIIKRDVEAARSRSPEPAAAQAGTAMASVPPAAIPA